MSLYIRIADPVQTKKGLLVSKLNALQALKLCELHTGLRKRINESMGKLNTLMSDVPNKVDEIKAGLPKVDVSKMGFKGGKLRCELCGKAFRNEAGLRQHMHKQHAEQPEREAKPVAAPLDLIEKRIEAIEKEITEL